MRKDRTALILWVLLAGFLSMIIIPTCNGQIPKDKQDHLLAGGLIGFSTSVMTIDKPALNSLAWSVGSAVVIGGGKELVYDKWLGQGTPEWNDFFATMTGSVIGWGAVQLMKKIYKPKKRNYTGIVFWGIKIKI